VFQFNGSGHTDTISDWNASDTIQIQSSQTSASAFLRSATVSLTDINDGTRLSFGGNTITLAGVQSSSLTVSNFLLPPGVTLNLVGDHGSTGGGFMPGPGFDPNSGGHRFGGFPPSS
jgi:hypothetical protein